MRSSVGKCAKVMLEFSLTALVENMASCITQKMGLIVKALQMLRNWRTVAN
jgi:hypothetical protein